MSSIRLISSKNLTKAHGDLQQNISQTYAGMAHFAGTGPAYLLNEQGLIQDITPLTCRSCTHWIYSEAEKLVFRRDPDTKVLKPRRCHKFQRMTQCENARAVPHFALSCRHYVPDERAPPVYPEKKVKNEKS